MILLIWLTSLIVSLAPQFGWKDEDFLHRIIVEKRCQVRHFFVDNSAKTEYLLYQKIFSALLWVPILLSQKFIYVVLLHTEARV